MTRAQTLAGAMGMAAWRAHWILNEYAAAATGGGTVFSRGGNPRFNHSLDPLGLNEVGVTDAVLATLWQFGPAGAAYAVSARVENRYFGADNAFVNVGRKRILLYQAKLARLDGAILNLKSRVPQSHVGHLTRRSVRVESDTFPSPDGSRSTRPITPRTSTTVLPCPSRTPRLRCPFPSDSHGGVRRQRPARVSGATTTRKFSSEDARLEVCSLPQSRADRGRSTRCQFFGRGRGSSTSSIGVNGFGGRWIRFLVEGGGTSAVRTASFPSSLRTSHLVTMESSSATRASSLHSFDSR